jgi:predicted  nucleic acid-binding Zn-ribbon protein
MPTVQETSIGEQLKSLIRLQHLDTQIDQVAKLRGDLPDEIRDLEDEKAGLETRILKYRQEREENEAASLQAERDIKEAEGLIKKYEEQQLQVRNNREYDALTKEIEAQKQRIVDAQAKIEEVANTREGSEALVTETETRLGELTTVLESKQKDLKEVLEDTKQ